MRCSCGHDNEPDRQRCAACGASLGRRGQAWWVWLLVFLGMVALAVMEYGVKRWRDPGEPPPAARDGGR